MDELTAIAGSFLGGIWMLAFPSHLAWLLMKYQLFLFRWFSFMPLFPFSTKEQASKPLFSEFQIRILGGLNIVLAAVLASKAAW